MSRKRILFALTPKWSALTWAAGMLLVSLWGYKVLTVGWLETGFLALLPVAEQQPEVVQVIQRQNGLMNRKMIWLIGANQSDSAINQARKVEQLLVQSHLFSRVELEQPFSRYTRHYQALFPYRYQLLDAQTQTLLANQPDILLQQNVARLNSPIGQWQSANFAEDPGLFFNRYFNSQHAIQLNLEQNVVIVPDKHKVWALLMSELHDTQLQLDKLETLQTLVDQITHQIHQSGGDVLVTGMSLFTAQGAASAKQEISTVGLGSSAGIVFLLLWTFRALRPVLLSSLAIASGLWLALVVSVWFFGKIHILTLVFGASLIGVADDYAQHFLCDSLGEDNWQPSKSLRFVLPGLALGLLSNLLSYAGLSFSPFPGLQQIALFSALGLSGAWLTVVLLFPLLLQGFRFQHKPELLRLTKTWEQDWPAWLTQHKWRLLIVLCVGIAGGIKQLSPQDDVRLLQSASPVLMQMAEKIRQLLPVSRDSQFFIVSGNNQQEWYQREQALLVRLTQARQQNQVQDYQGLTDYWPDFAQQQANYQMLKTTLYDSGLLAEYMANLGFAKALIATELQHFQAAQSQTLTLPDWLKTASEDKQALWLGCTPARCQSVVSLTGINDIASLKAFACLPGVVWVDQAGQLSELFGRVRGQASGLLTGAFVLAWLVLCLGFGWRNSVVIMSIPLVSVLSALAMLGWCGQLFSLFNLFALLLVLGIGVDYGLFFFMAGERRASTSLGVSLSALTTLLAFGLLAVSSTEIVHAFGFTVTVGIITALLCAPWVGFREYRNDKT